MRVCLQPMDFMQISTIASLHSIGLLCPTKPSKRAVHGAVLLELPSVGASFFMYRVHNSTVSRQLRYALTKERLCCMAVTPATYAPYAVAEMGEDVCAPAVCGAGVWYAVGRYNIRESIIGNLFVILLSILREGDRRTGEFCPRQRCSRKSD